MTARILVVEDNHANRALVDYLLRAHGYEPLLADNGADGLVLASEHRPDLILLDIRMPGLDGYAVAAAVREQPELGWTKIVALTASAMLGDRERIANAGFDGYIAKPIDPERFVSQVEPYLSDREHGLQPKAERR